MGCPAPKIAGNACGSALMRDPELCRRIVAEVCAAVPVPVTAKIRKGYAREQVNAVEVALACEAGGAAAVTVHGRTGTRCTPPGGLGHYPPGQGGAAYPGYWKWDVTTPQAAANLYEQTGCDLVMVGRGALGTPGSLRRSRLICGTGPCCRRPRCPKRMAVLCRQAELAAGYKGERLALLQARKHAAWYMRGLRGAAEYRRAAGTLETMEDLYTLPPGGRGNRVRAGAFPTLCRTGRRDSGIIHSRRLECAVLRDKTEQTNIVCSVLFRRHKRDGAMACPIAEGMRTVERRRAENFLPTQ